ncbi:MULTISPECIES: TVP38/TMEM64 family protein [Halostella]|uniref:TVP38/TMEM64 family protein n=1 Tax=Halostella TaxID=1843185 RepID=UPI001081BB17|nr:MULTISPECIES: VTT domain-containing protein [Halostella]
MRSLDRRTVAGFVLLGAVVAAGLFSSPEATLRAASRAAADPFLFAVVLVCLYLARPFVAWPTTAVAIVVGYGYGIALGVPVALAGAVLTSMPPFLGVRRFAGDAGFWGRLGDAGDRFFDSAGHVRGVTVARLLPVPADAVTCAAAASGVSLPAFAVGTVLGELPWTVAAVAVGSSAERVATQGLGEVGFPVVVAAVAAAGLLLAGPAYQYFGESDIAV